jgi:hypothetical protein
MMNELIERFFEIKGLQKTYGGACIQNSKKI